MGSISLVKMIETFYKYSAKSNTLFIKNHIKNNCLIISALKTTAKIPRQINTKVAQFLHTFCTDLAHPLRAPLNFACFAQEMRTVQK